MSWFKHVIRSIDFLNDPELSLQKIEEKITGIGIADYEVKDLTGEKGTTTIVKVRIHRQTEGEKSEKPRTLGIIGSLGGVGVRPKKIGLVSDADGAIVALACMMVFGEMSRRCERLPGDVIISTHVTPSAPILPHDPVPFVGSPINLYELLEIEVDARMDAVLSIDATKANRVAKWSGFAITPPVKEGWVLKLPDEILDIYERVSGRAPCVVPITTQDVTPYGTGISHINSIVQPWLKTNAPVVGVATTARSPIAGSATGANYPIGLEQATRFCIEVAKQYTRKECAFYDTEEFTRLRELYGDMSERFKRRLP
ncbi:MAG: DUF1177 domain-containing protein [Candidatus Korarchaeota archaeon]|nr:DUF1177 domain-containing protein [Candidatus Korarchaeota archaeon]NIU83832.1 DUF1177 family protein [Candidatus Thorarchaeota archaeon]NIW15246.1 DUF1177 family protein [Candidatus Thorarchaeota archaeon]NIW53223.1 DUF1177 family protein [Candidatus Korarchaeota archaeon]